ncbi:hypothetical protein [Pararhizobium sp.]|uniref:hypothetical protein n=1 Tax=Pararhizobium sp. TaxID=1977563 RepID=UPI002727A8E1|nr:hypothetical protein [Pararhizobium sp.]MDO9417002.1 hypothetical protein [Pararhizobium sp.]
MSALAVQIQTALELATFSRSDDRSAKIVHHLCAVYPGAVKARKLMGISGFASHRDPVTPFVEFLNIIIRINQSLSRHGWQAVRTGGTPDDQYRLAPVGD